MRVGVASDGRESSRRIMRAKRDGIVAAKVSQLESANPALVCELHPKRHVPLPVSCRVWSGFDLLGPGPQRARACRPPPGGQAQVRTACKRFVVLYFLDGVCTSRPLGSC